jgi:phospholipase C
VRAAGKAPTTFENCRAWDYAVSAGDALSHAWPLEDFEAGKYHLYVYGPNGFFRDFRGTADDPSLTVKFRPARRGRAASGDAELQLANLDPQRPLIVAVEDLAYGNRQRVVNLGPAGSGHANANITIALTPSFGWHDLRIRVQDAPHFEQRFAGHIENGMESFSDPAMGRKWS